MSEGPRCGLFQNNFNTIRVYSYSVGFYNKSQEPYFGAKEKVLQEFSE